MQGARCYHLCLTSRFTMGNKNSALVILSRNCIYLEDKFISVGVQSKLRQNYSLLELFVTNLRPKMALLG